MNEHKLNFKRFEKENYEEYKRWFDYEVIKSTLYDIDIKWLDFVLEDKTGIEYVVFLNLEMVAVVGIELPTHENPSYAIKNIAINPSRLRQGFGSLVLKELLERHLLKEHEYWIAFVEVENKNAQLFFDNNGWKKSKNEGGMIEYEKRIYIR